MFSVISRANQFAKTDKDLIQAATLVCVVEVRYPGDIADAMSAFPATGRAAMLKGAAKILEHVRLHSEQASEALAEAIAQARHGAKNVPAASASKQQQGGIPEP